MSKSIDKIIESKSTSRLKVYAYSLSSEAHIGVLKIGQTVRDVEERVREQVGTLNIGFRIELSVSAERMDGTLFSDHDVRHALVDRGHERWTHEDAGLRRGGTEWIRCEVDDVKAVVEELRSGKKFKGRREQNFAMRDEQELAVNATQSYFKFCWRQDPESEPKFLWNAKMRFGKTFAACKLAQRLDAKRVLVVTFKPVAEDAWRADVENHVDFSGWKFITKKSRTDISQIDRSTHVVYFCSFQDILGQDRFGNIKKENRWVHSEKWDITIFDEYHFGAWKDKSKELFEGEIGHEQEEKNEYSTHLDRFNQSLNAMSPQESSFLPIKSRSYLYLSGTPFRALARGEFVEEQIFYWTYIDEQRAKKEFSKKFPTKRNPYLQMPQMKLLTYKMPEEILAIASFGEFNEFDLDEFFSTVSIRDRSQFKHKDEVQKWLNVIRGQHIPGIIKGKGGAKAPPFPYSDARLLSYLQHSFWLLPNVSACWAMKNIMNEKHNTFWHDYKVIVAAGPQAGTGIKALPPVQRAIGSGHDTKTIVLSCGKLTTGVTVPQWSSILMLKNLKSPETYFQAAFRVQSAWTIKNPTEMDPNNEEIVKPNCLVFDFAPTRALRQFSDYANMTCSDNANPNDAVKDLASFLPVLSYENGEMMLVDENYILDTAVMGTAATLLARKWQSPALVNVDIRTLRRILENPDALAAIESIEGWRSLEDNIIGKIISTNEKIKKIKIKSKNGNMDKNDNQELNRENRYLRDMREKVQKKLIKFATRIPAFMYLTDYRESTLGDVISKIEPDLFRFVTGLTVDDFDLLVSLNVFNSNLMNSAVYAFRRYEDASLCYTGIDSHDGLSSYGLYDKYVPRG